MKRSTVIGLAAALAVGVGGYLFYRRHAASQGTPVNTLTPGGQYQMVVPVIPGMSATDMLASAATLGWTNVTQLSSSTASPGLLAAATANGIVLSDPNELVWQGTYNGAAAVPIAAGAAAARMS
jgi:hypothetical protein